MALFIPVLTNWNKQNENLVESTLHISKTVISKYLREHNSDTSPTFLRQFNYCYLKLLISQSKFSGTRKFTLRYQ